MKTHFDIENFIESGAINNEMDLERAMIADRKLRLLSKESVHFKNLRKKLRDLIEAYENKEWSSTEEITDEKIEESDRSEKIAEQERIFIDNRKDRIRRKLKKYDLTQENLGHILGHKSKTHMSELMNGIRPFTIKDLIAISILFEIELNELVPPFLSQEDRTRIASAITELNKPQVKPGKENLEFA
jgi:antitoxin component HigA of HigAB toxin-antitoxin module